MYIYIYIFIHIYKYIDIYMVSLCYIQSLYLTTSHYFLRHVSYVFKYFILLLCIITFNINYCYMYVLLLHTPSHVWPEFNKLLSIVLLAGQLPPPPKKKNIAFRHGVPIIHRTMLPITSPGNTALRRVKVFYSFFSNSNWLKQFIFLIWQYNISIADSC